MNRTDNALQALQEKLGDKVKNLPEQLYSVSYDGLKVSGAPQALIQVVDIMKLEKCSNWLINSVFLLLQEELVQALQVGRLLTMEVGSLICPVWHIWRSIPRICLPVVVQAWW